MLDGQITTVFPKNDSYLPNNNIEFIWNTDVNAIEYEIEISRDIVFSDMFYTTSGIIPNSTTVDCNEKIQYFWRIRYFDGSDNSEWSQSHSFIVYNPESLTEHCVFRLNADSVYHVANVIDTVYNNAGVDYFASQTTVTSKPLLIDAELNGRPVIRFDGNDFMNGDGLVGNLNEFSFICIVRPSIFSNFRWIYQNAPLVNGASFSITATSGSTFKYWPQGGAGTGLTTFDTLGSTSTFNMLTVINDNSQAGAKAELFSNGFPNGQSNAVSLVHDFDGYLIGVYSTSLHYFAGDIAELVLMDSCLNSQNRFLVENYFRNKYFPDDYIAPLDLGCDIRLDDSFCDTVLNAYKPYYNNYEWSNGETDSLIHVSNPGIYSVTATDVYGFQYVDSLQVFYPTVVQMLDTTMCSGSLLTWDTELVGAYTYEWLNSVSTDSYIEISTPNEYAVTVTDSYGCSYFSDTALIELDAIDIVDSLGVDRSVCSGESIGLSGYAGEISEYLWSTFDDTETITITLTDTYVLTVTSIYGCTSSDNIEVTIKGIAPIVDFETDTTCFGNVTSFTDLTAIVAPDSFESWSWDFGSGNTSNLQNPEFEFDSFGTFPVSLLVITDSGCLNSTIKDVIVKENPTASFDVQYGEQQCVGQEISFVNNSEPSGNIVSQLWYENNTLFSDLENPQTVIDLEGLYDVKLVVSADNGCADSVTNSIDVVNSMVLPSDINLVSPSNNFYVFDNNEIFFEWNHDTNAIYYKFELSKAQDFSTIIYQQNTTENTLTFMLADTSLYYWRIQGYNLCDDFSESQIFEINYLELDVSRMERWFDVSYNNTLVQDSLISAWFDKNTLEEIEQSELTKSPVLDTVTAINNGIVARFDGVDDNFIIPSSTNVGCAFAIARYSSTESIFLDYKGIINSDIIVSKSVIFSGNDGTNEIYSAAGSVFEDNIEINRAQTTVMSPFSEYSLIYGFTNDAESYSSLQIGGLQNNANRFWKGYIAEVIVYDTILNETEQNNVYQYLRYKYSPPVNLSFDIRVPYGFCDTAITTAYKPWFTSYEWSTGETDSIILVNTPGIYTVTVTDIFGFESSDDIRVFFPEVNALTDTLACLGEEIIWDVELAGEYTYEWYGSIETTQSITIGTEGDYAAIITDTVGCHFKTDTIGFAFDMYEFTSSVGPADTLLCAGNRLLLVENAEETATYNWSTGSSDPEIILSSSGEYSVTVTSDRGCEAIDTINITISGVVPVPIYSSIGHCEANEITFTDESTTASGNIISYHWTIEGDEVSTNQNLNYTFDEAGIYNVSLAIETDENCGDFISLPITVYPLPNVSYTPSYFCQNSEIEFESTSSLSEGSVAYNSWEFDDGAYTGETISHLFTELGLQTIKLISSSNQSCTDSIIEDIFVKSAALPVFEAENTCVGNSVSFINSTEYNPVNPPVDWIWDFDDETTDNVSNPTHVYNEAMSYDVSLSAIYANGCSVTSTQGISIYNIPEVSLSGLDACIDTPFTPNSEVTSIDGTVTSYSWQIGNPIIAESVLAEPVFTFNDTGSYQVILTIETDLACNNTVTGEIYAHENPVSDFIASRTWGAVPLWIDFTNQSIDAETYYWNFDGENFSTDTDPYFVFNESGSYEVQLISTSEFGCTDITTMTIKSIVPIMDIILYDLRTVVEDNYLKTTVYIINNGTLPVDNLDLQINLGDGKVYREVIDYFDSGEVLDYTFNLEVYVADGEMPDVVCVEAVNPTFEFYADINLENNIVCNTDVDALQVFQPYPNPSSSVIYCEFINAELSDVVVSLTNSIGEVSYKSVLTQTEGYIKLPIEVINLASGVYFLQVRTDTETKSFKVEVNR